MSTEVIVVPPEMTMREIAMVFSEAHISGVPVVSGGRVVGVVSTTDLLDFAAAPRGPDPASEGAGSASEPAYPGWPGSTDPPAEFFIRYWADRGVDVHEQLAGAWGDEADRLLDGFTVGDVMSRRLHSLPPETELSEAADYMLRYEIHRVLVMEDNRLVGVVTTVDMVRAMGGASGA